jgi:suppressor for copper-sensitivity B
MLTRKSLQLYGNVGLFVGLAFMATPSWAQIKDGRSDRPAGPARQRPVVEVSAAFTSSTSGQVGRLLITARIKPTWHIYSTTQPPGGPLATVIKLYRSKEVRLLGGLSATPLPEKKTEPMFDNLVTEIHHDRVTWSAPIEIVPGADPVTLKVEGAVRIQACSDESCLPPQEIAFTAQLAKRSQPDGTSTTE